MPQIVVTSIALFVFGLLLILTILRLRASKEAAVLHLLIYVASAFLAYLSSLIAVLQMPTAIGLPYPLLTELFLLLSILAFGTLTLSLLKFPRSILSKCWAGSLFIILLWITLAFNLWGVGHSADGAAGYYAAMVVAGASWIIAIASALAALWYAFQQQPSSKHLNRLRYWLIAATLQGTGGLILFISPNIFLWAGTPLLLAAGSLAGYVVLSYHTADLNRLIGQALRYAGSTGVIAAILYLGLAATTVFSRSQVSPINVFIWAIILAIFLAIITPPLWKVINRFFGRIIFGKHHLDERETIRHFSRRISTALDMQRLGDILINLMQETFNVERGIVFINERGDSRHISLRPFNWVGTKNSGAAQFDVTSLFINHFRQGNKFLHQYDIDVLPKFSAMDRNERAWLTGLNIELFVPIMRQRNIMGVLAFGSRENKTAYPPEEVDLMVALADQAVLAMDGARLFEHLATINQEVDVLNAQLQGFDQNKTDFLSIASHELRTPLTHVHGYSRMLLDLSEEEAKDYSYVKTIVEGIARGSERMKNVIDMMFDVTEANVGDLSLFLGPVDLAETVTQATGPFLPALDERRIAFDKKGFDELPVIEADGTRLVQAIENLFSNAIKYTPDGGVVTISGKSVVLDNIGSAVEIVMADTGIGIDPEHHEQIFEKFFRVDDTDHHSTGKTKFKGAGPGLGLPLVKGIADAHGGQVWVESKGHDEENYPGSKFIFIIPLHPVVTTEREERKQSQIETVDWSKKDIAEQAGEL